MYRLHDKEKDEKKVTKIVNCMWGKVILLHAHHFIQNINMHSESPHTFTCTYL